MNIFEAAKIATKGNRCMWRAAWGHENYILPTNTPECCIVLFRDKQQPMIPRWEPNAEDLVAEDWCVGLSRDEVG